MTHAGTLVVSAPGRERTARTPFGAPIVIHATAAGTAGAPAMRATLTPPGQGPDRRSRTRRGAPIRGLSRLRRGPETTGAGPDTTIPKNRRPRA
jgi:hypothetical protein